MAEQSQQGTLFTIVRQGSLHLDLLRYHKQVQCYQSIPDVCHQVGSVLNELVDANTSWQVDAIGYGKDLTPLFEGKIVISAPLFLGASVTSIPSERPEIIRFRAGKFLLSGLPVKRILHLLQSRTHHCYYLADTTGTIHTYGIELRKEYKGSLTASKKKIGETAAWPFPS